MNPFQNDLDFREGSAGDQVVPGAAEKIACLSESRLVNSQRIRVKVGANRTLRVCNKEQTNMGHLVLSSCSSPAAGAWDEEGGRGIGQGLGWVKKTLVWSSAVLTNLCRTPSSSVRCLPGFTERVS